MVAHSDPFQVYLVGCGIVVLLGAGPSTTVATQAPPEQAVDSVNTAPKSFSFWRVAGLVPAFCEAYVIIW